MSNFWGSIQALAVEEDETFDPIDVGFFGADGVVLESGGVSYLVE